MSASRLVILRVENFVLDTSLCQQLGQKLTLFDRCRSNQNRTASSLALFDFAFGQRVLLAVHAVLNDNVPVVTGNFADVDVAIVHEDHVVHVVAFHFFRNRTPLVFFAGINDVRMSNPQHCFVGGNRDHIKFINFVELFRLGHRRTGHSTDLVVKLEVVL